MYGSFFGFSSRLFAAAPMIESYFPAQTIELSRQSLIRIIQRAEGPGLIVGAAGVGKSLLCRLLAEYFRDTLNVAVLSAATIGTRKALLQSILYEFNLPYRDMEEGELRLTLLDFLQPGQSRENGILLLMDEADSLPLKLLDEIRMITNLVRDGQPRAHLVLAGGPALDERFTNPKLESFNQRLAARCYLEPLTYDETIRYVRSQINTAGGDPSQLFTEEALQAIHRASDGIPRLINQVCDHSLLLACAGGRAQLDAASIGEAWADLQQLPAPWYDHDAQPAADVEFGQLEELGEEEVLAEEQVVPQLSDPGVQADHSDHSDPGHGYDAPGELLTSANLPLSVFDTGWQNTFEELDEAVNELAPFDGNVTSDDREHELIQYLPIGDLSQMPQMDHPIEISAEEMKVEPKALSNNPFGGVFDEEEIVLDRLASLEIEALRDRPKVVAQESHELRAVLSAFDAVAESTVPAQEEAEPTSTSTPYRVTAAGDDTIAVEQDWDLPPQVGSPLFEYSVVDTAPGPELMAAEIQLGKPRPQDNDTNQATPPPSARVEILELNDVAIDDRDLIIVKDESDEAAVSEQRVRSGPPTVEYQELFAQLRKV